MTKKNSVWLLIVFFCFSAYGQEKKTYLEKGNLSIGLRTTSSLFGHDNVPGLGTGGQFRLQLFDFLSTEWFADWITLDLNGAGTRKNAHVGWSVLFYPKKINKFVPYLIAGHCFDYAEITPLSTSYIDRTDEKISRWSSAVQAGVGTHYFLSDRFNLTFSAQYMLHLGKHLDYELTKVSSGYYLKTDTHSTIEQDLEGHVLVTLSLNYKLGDLW